MDNRKTIIDSYIENAKIGEWKTCIYGLGMLGVNCGEYILHSLGLNCNYYCDGNYQKVIEYKGEGEGLSKSCLLSVKDDLFVLMCVGLVLQDEVREELEKNEKLHIVLISEASAVTSVVEDFYGLKNIDKYSKRLELSCPSGKSINKRLPSERIAVYVCITGGYDDPVEPEFVDPLCDYFLISDEKIDKDSVYKWIDIDTVCPDQGMGNKEKNRYCKMHGSDIFSEYKYSIYVDGGIEFKGPITEFIDSIGESGLAIHKHRVHNCIYVEGMRIVWGERCTKEEVVAHMKRYILEGMPRNYGLLECTIIVRDNHNIIADEICNDWFKEYMSGAKRDQFSLPYIMWKKNLSLDWIGVLNEGKGIDKNPYIRLRNYHKK